MGKKALLMILDGWGIGDHKKDDVIYCTPTPYWDDLLKTYSHTPRRAAKPSTSWDLHQTVACTARLSIFMHFATSPKSMA